MKRKKDIVGKWHIYKMEMWDKNYINMEVRAYIKINPNNSGSFQFGLVSDKIDGRVVIINKKKRFEFTWEGNAECDYAFGSGWCRIEKKDCLKGEFKFHEGDISWFSAKRVK